MGATGASWNRSLRFKADRSCGRNHIFSSYIVYFVLLFAASWSRPICAQGFNFSVSGSSYNCSSNLICLNQAHRYDGDSNGLFAGNLSLILEQNLGTPVDYFGIAYHNEPVRMLDPSTRWAASFNTSFVINEVPFDVNNPGDGFAFVLSADNSATGFPGGFFGFFDAQGNNSFRSIVVEFDNYQNGAPQNDIDGNHVSFDFQNVTAAAVKSASEVNVQLWNNLTTYAWVEYSNETQLLEARISTNNSRPSSALLSHTVDLFDVVEEYMWVGFAGATGDSYSYYYIGDWSFESYGIPSAPISTKAQSKLGNILGISAGVLVLLVIAGILVLLFVKTHGRGIGRRVRHFQLGRPKSKADLMVQFLGMPGEFSYKQLSVATEAFREESKLGQGGFGSVYRGVLPSSGTLVAVKKISADSKQGEREFMTEVSIITQLRHRNLIQLMGWCRDRGKYLLVYELMPNGSLDKALFSPDEEHSALSWSQRLNIITGTAAAVDYLHQGWKQQVIHRDIKASNIMLDNEWNAKLGDFGLARLVDHQGPSATTIIAGTYGYIAPEAAASGKFTEETDVYAFGAVVLEIACGRAALEVKAPADEILLVDWVWQRLSEGDLLSVVDRRLDDYDAYWMEVVLLMGLLCSHPNPMSRPSLQHVLQVLAGDAPVPPVPVSRPTATFTDDTHFVSITGPHWTDSQATTSCAPSSTFSRSLTGSRISTVFSEHA